MDCFVAFAPRNDESSVRHLAARIARVVHELFAQKTEGAGNAGCPLHPQPRVRCVESTRVSHHRFTGDTRPSLRNGFNGFLHALPGARALLPPSLRRSNTKLDASVGASGPHDFAVRAPV